MKKIHQLSPQLIAQIAAGEVIERPSYAVKELLDNAIDANATEININLENSGLKKITITDNGDGMSKEDLFDSYKIHTTSKVKNEESLTAIKSMGFRGEALASIAAISKLKIKTKTEQDVSGYVIELDSGKLINDQPIGMAKGTSIEISNIFESVPARKKFLKAPQTELRNIIEVFLSFALTFPNIRFTFIHNKKTLYDLPKTNDLFSRISTLLPNSTTQYLIPITGQNEYIKINGFIAKPELTTQSSSKQFLFVNNRRISDKTISQAIRDSYASLIPDKLQPIFLLFISVPFELVDVNVHPRKEQLAFYSTDTIYNAVFDAVSQTLNSYNLNFSSNEKYQPITNSTTGTMLKASTVPWQVINEKLIINWNTIQQIHNLYIIVETKYGLLFVDQHAAHERILFEQFKSEFEKQKIKTLKLSQTIKTNLTISEKLLIDEYKNEFSKLGLIFDQKYSIVRIPTIFQDRNIQKVLKELLENLEQKGQINIDTVSLKILQFLACKNAIKAGDKLEKNEAIKLIKKLEETPNNYTCPHGRPTKYIFGTKEINTIFKRF